MKNNKLIAEFMGGEWKWENKPSFTFEAHYPKMTRVEQCELPFDTLPKSYKNNRFQPKGLYYHEDWNWLMPVVQKCYKIDDEEGFDNLVDAVSTLNIDGTYKAVVEFINQTKTK